MNIRRILFNNLLKEYPSKLPLYQNELKETRIEKKVWERLTVKNYSWYKK